MFVFIHFQIVLFYTEVICPHLSLVDGKVTYNTSFLFTFGELPWTFVPGYRVNTSVSFSCDEYYRREGSSSAICQSSGNWSQQAPTCAASNKNENLYSIDVCYFEQLKNV